MQISEEVLGVLSLAEVAGNAVRLTMKLERKLYERTNKILEAAGGKWNRKAQAHLFEADAGERIDQILLTGSVDIPRDEFDFFETPPEVVDMVLQRAGIKQGMSVLEPSAGRAALVLPLKGAADVHCIELMPANAQYLLTLDWLDGVSQADFLSIPPLSLHVFDRVVMNPPFSKQADIKHVTHAMRFLAPGGRLVAVMSASVTFRNNRLTADFRAMVEAHGGIIEPLPAGAFKASGTMVNTVLVTIDK